MKAGDTLINKKTLEKEKITSSWVVNDTTYFMFGTTLLIDNPKYFDSYIWNFYVTEKELRKLKLKQLYDKNFI